MTYSFHEWLKHKIIQEVFSAIRDIPTALQVMGLSNIPDENTLKTIHRKLVMQHHPDRGGNPEQFKKVQAAYEALRSELQRTTPTTGFTGNSAQSGFNRANKTIKPFRPGRILSDEEIMKGINKHIKNQLNFHNMILGGQQVGGNKPFLGPSLDMIMGIEDDLRAGGEKSHMQWTMLLRNNHGDYDTFGIEDVKRLLYLMKEQRDKYAAMAGWK